MNHFEQFAKAQAPNNGEILEHVRAYMEWRASSLDNFKPSIDDDIHLRTYLLELKHAGTSPLSQRKQLDSIRKFYQWAKSKKLIEDEPEYYFNVERPILAREQIRKREEIFSGSQEQRELARMKVLNKLSEELNRAYDIQTTMQTSLEALVSTLGLKTAWAYLLPNARSPLYSPNNPPLHDFALAGDCGLPPGLQLEDKYFLCSPGDCHCQDVLRTGQMRRAVNIVQCTRLEEAAEADGDNQGLLFHASVPIITENQPLGIINVATEEWQFLTSNDLQLLSTVGAQVAVALERCLLYELTNNQRMRMERELQLAHDVQTNLLPDMLPEIPGYSLAAEWQAAREMAGDFYDVFPIEQNIWGIVVADVSDKGAPAAMYMAMTRSLLRVHSGESANPAGSLLQVDQHLNAYSGSGMFVSVFYGILDITSNILTYASAGHDPPLLRRYDGEIERLMPTGPLIGVLDDIQITNACTTFSPGDTLCVYTDGVTDALNAADEHYGAGRLEKVIANLPASSAAAQLEFLKSDLSAFIGDAPSFDDITYVMLSVIGS